MLGTEPTMKLNSSQRVVIVIAIITIDELEIVVGSQPPGSGLESFGGKDRGVVFGPF